VAGQAQQDAAIADTAGAALVTQQQQQQQQRGQQQVLPWVAAPPAAAAAAGFGDPSWQALLLSSVSKVVQLDAADLLEGAQTCCR
jgi:hypothetical protein